MASPSVFDVFNPIVNWLDRRGKPLQRAIPELAELRVTPARGPRPRHDRH